MKMLIRMVSGKEIKLETKSKSIKDWIFSNFTSNNNFIWYIPTEDGNIALNFNNIELLEISE